MMAGAQTSPPSGHRKPLETEWKEGGGVGAAVTGLLLIGAAGLRHSWRSMAKRGPHSNSGARTEGMFKCEHCSNKSGAGSKPDLVTEQNGGPGWCAAILGQNIFSQHAMLPNCLGEAGAKQWQQNANGSLFAEKFSPALH